MADAARRHADEMQALRERLEIEKQAWQENYMKKQVSAGKRFLSSLCPDMFACCVLLDRFI